MHTGGVGVDIHVCSIHELSDFIISWNLSCVSSHWVGVSWLHWRIVVRVFSSRFFYSRNVVQSFWILVGGMG